MGRFGVKRVSQKTCHKQLINELSGERPEMMPPNSSKRGDEGYIISFSFFLEAHFSNQNFLKDEQETFSDNCISGRRY